jgi:hypothetical protein
MCLLAKRAKTTIVPNSLLQTVRHPNPIFNSQPCKEFNFRGRPTLPNYLVHLCECGAKELRIVSRCGGVLSILHKVPSDLVDILLIEMNAAELRLKS